MVVDGYPWLLSVINGCGVLSMVIERYQPKPKPRPHAHNIH